MNIVVIGAGGVGGYFGGRLVEAGQNVIFLVRGKTLESIRDNGLIVKSIHGDFKVNPKVTDKIEELGVPDLIILAVKSWQVTGVAKLLKPIVKEGTLILPLQNGADNESKLLSILNRKNVITGFCKIISKIEGPGRIHHMGAEPEIVFGEIDNQKTERIKTVLEVLRTAKFKSEIAENIHLEIWKKFLFITTISGIGGLCRVSLGVMRESMAIRRMMQQTSDEIIAVAQKKGIPLTEEHKHLVFHFIDKLPFETTASMQRDIMQGKPSEVHDLNGFIVREGENLQIKTPINYFIYNCLVPMETQVRKRSE